jgi:predicted pyridoxine 5'-phosphate oxidase superfamily flavin-nucleotide-binding protein
VIAEPFHEGERRLQAAAGSAEWLAEAGPRVVRDYMPEQHREFFPLLPWLLVGALDAAGQPWATALAGPAGFVSSPDPRTLRIAAVPAADDPLAGALTENAPVGLLGLQPQTRRRNRANGHVVQRDAAGFTVHVDQSFGNCPKYIQAREPRFAPWAQPRQAEALATLDEEAQALVRGADTFFIASAHPRAATSRDVAQGVDVSHRGGKPGFVRVDVGGVLAVPDFLGNDFYNTLGNLVLEPRCGLLFIDHANGHMLHLAAHASIVTHGPEVERFEGARRVLRLEVTQGLRVRHGLALRWGPAALSPHLQATGHW